MLIHAAETGLGPDGMVKANDANQQIYLQRRNAISSSERHIG